MEKKKVEEIDDISFDLVDEDTVNRLERDGKVVVPKKKIKIPKDKRWNEKQMGSKILQGIKNGDSVRDIAKSLLKVVDNNMLSAIRNARTMTTSAENHGRLDSYKALEASGIVQKKEWMSTPDDRTRPSHIDIDGEEQDIDKPFSNGCMFPGDGRGPAEEVWMCRCTMTDHIIGFRKADGTISYVDGSPDNTLHDEQIEEERERRGLDTEPKREESKQEEVKLIDNALKFDSSRSVDEYFRGSLYDAKIGGINKTRGYGITEDPKKPATAWQNKLTYNQSVAITDYTGMNYGPINDMLRGVTSEKEAKEYFSGRLSLNSTIKNIDSALNKFELKEPITVYRTCEREFLDKLSVGSIFHDEGYGSTSMISKAVASGDVHFIIDVPSGKGVGAYVDGLSWKEGEEFEFLLARGANYHVVDISEKKGETYVRAVITGFSPEK